MHSVADVRVCAHTRSANHLSYRSYSAPMSGSLLAVGRMRSMRPTASGEAAALKLDTRILEGNPFSSPRPEHVPYSDPAYRGRAINYPIYENSSPYRVKIQEFSQGGFEVVLSKVNLQRTVDRASMHIPRGPRTERKGDQESIEKAKRRAKRTVRFKVKEMGADHLITFTTRKTISRDELKGAWGRFTDNVSYHLKRKFEYVCVCEPHPTNPDHLHLHAAIRGRLTPREMVIFRRCWYIALGGTGKERGADVPGGFNIRHIKAGGSAHRRMDKIASYISKYITKEDCAGFNKKRYWASKINLKEVRAYWLKAVTFNDAIVEFCRDFDFEIPGKGDHFIARNMDLIWMRFCPDDQSELSPVPF